MSIYHPRIITGYHGCDRETLRKVVLEGENLKLSQNKYDWLGEGAYFWENGKSRAWEFAKEQKARGRINEPAVLGAYIDLGRCLDLTDVWATDLVRDFHGLMQQEFSSSKKVMPVNRKSKDGHDLLLRFLDCAVINFGLAVETSFQTVRGVFVEGDLAYENGGIFRKTHIQIAVRDPQAIVGVFVPHRN